MLGQALVSVIMPIYNAEKYLEASINSVLAQTYQNIELILINDGSMDNSEVLCNQFVVKDSRVRAFHIDNCGPGGARNFGIEKARGDYIQFIDSDDTIERDMVEEMVRAIRTNKADLVICGIRRLFIHNNQQIIDSIPTKVSSNNEIKNDFIRLLKQGLAYSPCNKLYKKSIIIGQKVQFDLELLNGEDAVFNIDYFSHCKRVIILDSPFYLYTQRNESLIHHYYKDKEKAQVYLFNKLNKYLSNHINREIRKELHAYYLMEFSYVIFQNSVKVSNVGDLFQAMKETKRFVKTPEFNDVLKNTYSYSWIQRLVLLCSKFKGESFMVFSFFLFSKIKNRNLLHSIIEVLTIRELALLGGI